MTIELKKLKNINLFEEFEKESLERFADIMEEVRFSSGDLIFAEGDTGDALFVIVEGKVEIRKFLDIHSGREKILATLRAGDFFGDMSLYSGEVRSASVYAASDCLLMKIPSSDYMKLTRTDAIAVSKLSYAIIKVLGNRLRSTSRELVVLFETGKIAGSITDPDELCHTILNRVAELMQAEGGILALYNDLSTSVEVKASKGFQQIERSRNIVIGKDRGIIGRVFNSGEPIIARCIADDPELSRHYHLPDSVRSALCVPLASHTDSQATGALLLCDNNAEHYGDSEINLLMGVSRQISTALENARLNFEAQARRDYKRVYIQPNF